MEPEDTTDYKTIPDGQTAKEIQFQKMKEEREVYKNEIKKLQEEELQKEKIRVVKVNEFKKDDIGNSNLEKMNKVGKAASKLTDLQWILDRFTH